MGGLLEFKLLAHAHMSKALCGAHRRIFSQLDLTAVALKHHARTKRNRRYSVQCLGFHGVRL
jgi:hypothetical protein